jgi:Holliday junction resolvasome RuvABC endonuclease subunit
LSLRVAPEEDASDALAAAVCHAHHQQMSAALSKANYLSMVKKVNS